MRREYRDKHRGLPDLPGLSQRLPALPAVCVGDNSPRTGSEDPHQLQSAFWSGGQRLQVRVHSSFSLSLLSFLPPSLTLSSILPGYSVKLCHLLVKELYICSQGTGGGVWGWDMALRLLAITSEEMGFVGFCNSYLIRREGVLWHLSLAWVFGRDLEENKPSKAQCAPAFYWWEFSLLIAGVEKCCLLFIWRLSLPVCICMFTWLSSVFFLAGTQPQGPNLIV